jgi:hypothetical protein
VFRAYITRRQALRGGLVAAGSLAAATAFPMLDVLAPTARGASQLTYDSFAAQLGTQFRLDAGILLRLASVKRLQPPHHPLQPRATGEGFVLEFEGSAPLTSATYQVEHGRLGTFEMFLSPVGVPGGIATAEAVFNRLWS